MRKKPFDFVPHTLGEYIKKKRLELGLTQKEVGKMLGATSFTVLNWEKGKTEPLPHFISGINLFLGVANIKYNHHD
ncbi:HTH cro/C1-type domain-containing protein [Candidatus Nitrotoga sp. HW29]|uniref:helix-turn-helix domain-containing protein n=1 Tax=Candidatus Nitrotoga sp. HW29 TaxID=2886963 RepID=UPI001EF2208F|nr:helix-turn-helix domain-containing protein [Candidatus Nitrotoga sp. HW29]CAH1903598.1 HTH cro/C1-type domain-containing protein [Candidatus Nitrotoga sp. HW29]